jgi:integrase
MTTSKQKKQHFRHQNGFGSIVKLSGKRRKPYAVRITTGWKDGKQVRKYLGYYKTQREAVIALADYHQNSYDIDMRHLTLGEVYDRWISRIENKVTQNALNAHNMAKNRFGNMANVPIYKIKADQLQDWMDSIELKPSSKIRLKSTMNQVFKYAIKNGIISTNYVEYVEIDEKVEKTGKIFTDEEIKTLWENKDDPTCRWILILIYTGMRIGELLLMTSSTMFLESGYMVGGLKTEAGKDRVIPIHNDIMPLVKEQLGRAKFLMRNTHGNKLTYQTALRHFDATMEKFGWEHKPHDTRKTAVSLMHGAGIPIETVRIIVGHSGKGVTEQVYLYKTPHELVDAINTIKIKFV